VTATLAIVPVKSLALAKGRLAHVLAPAARRRLVLAMLEDALALLGEFGAAAPVLVVTPDAEVAALAESRGAAVLGEDGPHGLNAAVRRGLAYAGGHGCTRALVIPADVPLATSAELRALLDLASSADKAQAILVPSQDGGGTNALLLSPPDILQPAFGPDSFVRHVAEAVALGLDFRVLHLAGLAADIDQPADLAHLLAATRGSDRYAFIAAEMGAARSQHREGEP
jgi:2-phospho-L-lactate guanylyltransferase